MRPVVLGAGSGQSNLVPLCIDFWPRQIPDLFPPLPRQDEQPNDAPIVVVARAGPPHGDQLFFRQHARASHARSPRFDVEGRVGFDAVAAVDGPGKQRGKGRSGTVGGHLAAVLLDLIHDAHDV